MNMAVPRRHPGYEQFPEGFFSRVDEGDDANFYASARMVTHIDEGAIAAVGDLYEELGVNGRVLDLMSSWISHFRSRPEHLTVLGMNESELQANEMAHDLLVHDLNDTPTLPYPDNSFDDAVCVVSVDYLTQPLEVFAEVARVVRPGGRFVTTFSNRLFPTKAIRGWYVSSDSDHCALVSLYFKLAGGFDPAVIEDRSPGRDLPGPQSRNRPQRFERSEKGGLPDPLYAVWATVT